LPTKPYVAKTLDGRSHQSWGPEAVCAIVEIASGGEVAAYPGFEEALAAEAGRRGFTLVEPGRWRLEPGESRDG